MTKYFPGISLGLKILSELENGEYMWADMAGVRVSHIFEL